MAEECLTTVVITTFKRLDSCKRAVKSVLKQSVPVSEIIIVEDGSRSGIEVWLKTRNFQTVKYIRHETNKGLSAARNTGLRMARGKYIAFLDDDDEWTPKKIEKQLAKFENLSDYVSTKTGVVYCKTAVRRLDGEIVCRNAELNSGNLKNSIIKIGPKTASSSFLFKANAIRNIGGFDQNLVSSIDHDIWMALAAFGYHAYFVDECLVIADQRTGRDTMMVDTKRRLSGVQQFLEKWSLEILDWLGVKKGKAFLHHYFSRVVSKLVLSKVSVGMYQEAWSSIVAIYRYGPGWYTNTRYVAKAIFIGFIKRFIPDSVLKKSRVQEKKITR